MSETRKLTLDPTNLSPDDVILLSQLLREDEKTKKGDVKYEPNQPHTFVLGDESYEITFTHKLARRPKFYKQVVIVNSDEEVPLVKEGSTLYLKKDQNNNYFILTRSDPNPVALTPEQVAQLETFNLQALDQNTLKQILSICHHDEIYLYQTLELLPTAKGAFGRVYKTGKLEHSPDGMRYIDYKTPRPVENTPRKQKVAKVQSISETMEAKDYQHRVQQMDLENSLWQRDIESKTKPSIRIKSAEGRVVEDIMVQNLFEGEELHTLLTRNKLTRELTPFKCLHMTKQLVAELKKVHELDIRHRDIKARNIMVNANVFPVTIKITDFGVALDKEGPVEGVAGTPGYIPPEIYAKKPVTQQGDVYAMGLVLRELWQDAVWIERQKISAAEKDDNSFKRLMLCEHILGVGMRKADIPPELLKGLSPEEVSDIMNMLNHFTNPNENKRLSFWNKAILEKKPDHNESSLENTNTISVKYVLNQIAQCSAPVRLLLLSEILEELQNIFIISQTKVPDTFLELQKIIHLLLKQKTEMYKDDVFMELEKLMEKAIGDIADLNNGKADIQTMSAKVKEEYDPSQFPAIAAYIDLNKVNDISTAPDLSASPSTIYSELPSLVDIENTIKKNVDNGPSKTKIALFIVAGAIMSAAIIAASIFSFGAVAAALGFAVTGLGVLEMGLVIGGAGILGGLIVGKVSATRKNNKEISQEISQEIHQENSNELNAEASSPTQSKKSTASIATRLAKAIGWPSTRIASAEHPSPPPKEATINPPPPKQSPGKSPPPVKLTNRNTIN